MEEEVVVGRWGDEGLFVKGFSGKMRRWKIVGRGVQWKDGEMEDY